MNNLVHPHSLALESTFPSISKQNTQALIPHDGRSPNGLPWLLGISMEYRVFWPLWPLCSYSGQPAWFPLLTTSCYQSMTSVAYCSSPLLFIPSVTQPLPSYTQSPLAQGWCWFVGFTEDSFLWKSPFRALEPLTKAYYHSSWLCHQTK